MDLHKIYELVIAKLISWFETLVIMLPNAAFAVLVVVLFYLMAKLARKVSGKIIGRFSDNISLNKLFATLVYSLVLGLGLFMALGILDLDKTVTSLLAGAGIIGLALGFAFQDTAANFMAGIIMAIRKPFRSGDIIESSGFFGRIVRVNLRTTEMITFDGQDVLIPNKQVFQNAVINYTKTTQRRVDIAVGVSYGDSLETVRKITLNAITKLPMVLEEQGVDFYFIEFADSSINFEARFWIDYTEHRDYMQARSEAIMTIKEAFDQNSITIPFPIRTLDFGIKGGEKLSATMKEFGSLKAS